MSDRRDHWESVYDAKRATELSWHQDRPDISLKLIRRTRPQRADALIDIGGGASSLAAHLLDEGFPDVTVLDIAEAALAHARHGLPKRASHIEWITADVMRWTPPRRYALWHDRAVFHFLTDPREQAAYARVLKAALAPTGWFILGGFAPGGPTRCSGLDIVQHDADSLATIFGAEFRLLETHAHTHATPNGAEQAFRFHIFARAPLA